MKNLFCTKTVGDRVLGVFAAAFTVTAIWYVLTYLLRAGTFSCCHDIPLM